MWDQLAKNIPCYDPVIIFGSLAEGKTFFGISCIVNIAQTRFLARLFIYSFVSQILDFLYVLLFLFLIV